MKREINDNTIIVGEFKTPLTPMDRSTKQKVNKETQTLNDSIYDVVSSVQFSPSVVSHSLRPHESQHARPPCPSPAPGVHPSQVHRVSDAIQPSHPLLSPVLLPPVPPKIKVFSNESTLRMRWPKYWSFSFSIIPCKEIPGLISFRTDWLDLLAVQGTLKNVLQHHSLKASSTQ